MTSRQDLPRCETCRFMRSKGPSVDYPHRVAFCVKGHWEGIDSRSGMEECQWDDCVDYDEPETQTETDDDMRH